MRNQLPVEPSAPSWMVTYGDMMSLLLCVFIVLVSMSEIKADRFHKAAASLHEAFGGSPRESTTTAFEDSGHPLIERVSAATVASQTASATTGDQGDAGDGGFEVTSGPAGLRLTVGGVAAFDAFDAALKPAAEEWLERAAALLRESRTRILVRGHAADEPGPDDSLYDDPTDLSYARARAVARVLQQNGVDSRRIVLVAMGDAEPSVDHAYTEERRALNRRVEIVVTEDLVADKAGSIPAADQKGFSDGG